MSDRSAIEVICKHCGHKQEMVGLEAWTYIILKGYRCEKCEKENTLEVERR